MLSVLLTILKIIGIILAVIVGLVLLIILAILFAPIRYRIDGSGKIPDYSATAKANWLLFVLRFNAQIDNDGISYVLKLFGFFTLKTFRKDFEKVKEWKNTLDKLGVGEDPDDEPIGAGEAYDHQSSRKLFCEPSFAELSDEEILEQILADAAREAQQTKEKQEQQRKKLESEHEENSYEKPHYKGRGFIGKTVDKVTDKIKAKAKAIYDKIAEKIKAFFAKVIEIKNTVLDKYNKFIEFKDDPENIEAIKLLKDKLILLLKHYRPRRIRGWVRIGFDDPARTGWLTGIFYLLIPAGNKTFKLYSEFQEEVIEGDIKMKGRMRLNHLALALYRCYKNDRIRTWINDR